MRGTVEDAASGAPIAGVSVHVETSPLGAVSNADGSFVVPGLRAGTYRITASHVAFRSVSQINVRVLEGSPTFVRLALEPRIHEFPPTVVYADREPRPAPGAPARAAGGMLTRLEGAEIRALGARHLGEALAGASAVQINERRAGGPVTASVRGSGPERVLVLVDGHAINDPATGVADLRQVPAGNISRVEVRRGAMAGALGGGGLGGVISVVTGPGWHPGGEAGTSKQVRARVDLGQFGWRALQGRADLGWTTTRAQISGAWSSYRGDTPVQWNPYPYARNPNGDRAERYVHASAEGRIPRTVWMATGACSLADAEGGVPGTLEFVTPTARAWRQRLSGQVGLRRGDWRPGESVLRFDLSFSRTEQQYLATAWQDGQPAFPADRNSEAELLQGEALAAWGSPGEVGRWQLRLQAAERRFIDQDHLKPDRGVGSRERREAGADLESRWNRPLARGLGVQLQLGLRADWLETTRWKPSPRLGAELGPSSGSWRVGAALAQSFRPPTLNDLYWAGDLNLSGNPELRVERATSFDAQFELRPLPGARSFLRFWRSEIEDFIHWRAGPALQWAPANLPAARLTGLESAFEWRNTRGLSAEASLTLQRAENRDPADANTFGKQLPYRAERLGQGRLGWQHRSGHQLSLSLRALGRQPTTAANTAWVEAYLLFDLATRLTLYQGPGWRMLIGLESSNLLDRHYRAARDALPPGREIRVFMAADRGN